MSDAEVEQSVALANRVMTLCEQAGVSDEVGINALVMATATVGTRLGFSLDDLRRFMREFLGPDAPPPVTGGNVVPLRKPEGGA